MLLWLKIISLAGALFPAVLNFVKTVEDSAKAGPEKKAAVLAMLRAFYEGTRQLVAPGTFVGKVAWEALEPIVSVMVDALVLGLNSVGVFHKAEPAPAPAA